MKDLFYQYIFNFFNDYQSKKYAEIVIPNYGDGFSTVYKEGCNNIKNINHYLILKLIYKETAGFAIIDHPLRGLLVENIMQTILMRKKYNEEKEGKIEI